MLADLLDGVDIVPSFGGGLIRIAFKQLMRRMESPPERGHFLLRARERAIDPVDNLFLWV